eukprot:12910163-Prorocentrum_lima.AAC.1
MIARLRHPFMSASGHVRTSRCSSTQKDCRDPHFACTVHFVHTSCHECYLRNLHSGQADQHQQQRARDNDAVP